MTYADWDPALETGDSRVDAEHRAIYALVNDMYQLIEHGEERQVLESALTQVQAYAAKHFAHEEQLMAEIGYPDLEQHCELHRAFSAEVERLSIEQLAGVRFSATGLTEFMRTWLDTHIETEDRKIGEFLKVRSPMSAQEP
jgi:hemerythrin